MSQDIQKPVERTEAQREAARLNGAKSNGPRTPEGKANSSQNARKHGFSARKFLLEDEPEEFATLLEDYRGSYRPANRAEDDLVREIAVYRFRLERVWEHRVAAFNLQRAAEHLELHPGIKNPDDKLLAARTFLTQSRNGEREAIDRHESHFSRLYNRALRNLLQLQRHRIKYHSEPAREPVVEPALQNEPQPERLYSINEVINAGHIPSLRPIPVRNVDVVSLLSADDPDLDINEPDLDEPNLEKAS